MWGDAHGLLVLGSALLGAAEHLVNCFPVMTF